MKTLQAESPMDNFQNMAIRLSKIKKTTTKHQDIHAKTYNDKIVKHSRGPALERSVNFTGGLKSILRSHNPRLCSAVVYTGHLISSREGYLTCTNQGNISENIKSNEYIDETTMRTRQQEITTRAWA